jgi:hypothetical protein
MKTYWMKLLEWLFISCFISISYGLRAQPLRKLSYREIGRKHFFSRQHRQYSRDIALCASSIEPIEYKSDDSDPNKNTNANISQTISLNIEQIEPFLRIAIPYFKENSSARNQLLQVLALTFANAGISVLFSYIGRDFYNSLNARDEAQFIQQIGEFFAAIVLAVPVSVYYRFQREKLSLTWREGLTGKVLDQYYSNKTFYVLETLKDIDNPGTPQNLV